MISATVKASLVSKLNALPLFTSKEFAAPALDVSRATDAAYLIAYSQSLIEAKAKHDRENNVPEDSAQVRNVALSLLKESPIPEEEGRSLAVSILSDIFTGCDDKEFAEGFNSLKAETQKAIGIINYSEKDFFECLSFALREGKNAGIPSALASRMSQFIADVSKPDCNFSATYKKYRFTLGLANTLKSSTKVQNLRLGISKKDLEASNLTIAEALAHVVKGETPYAIPAPTPKEETPTVAKPAAPTGKKK
jgi:hypothetical protein